MNKNWTRVAAVILAALLLWWLFWAILADEDINEMEMQNTEIVEWEKWWANEQMDFADVII